MNPSRKDGEKISHKSATASSGGLAVVGDISNTSIHLQTAQTAQPVDLKDFQDQLTEFRQQLSQANLESAVAQDLAAEVQGVQEQAEREKPNVPMILGKLNTVTDVLSSATNAATKLVPLARKLGEMASTWV